MATARNILLQRLPAVLRRPFENGWFALFMLFSLLFWNGLMLTLSLAPAGDGELGAFTSDFRRWCLNYDETTGGVDWSYAVPFISVPLVLGTATLGVYYAQLKAVLRRPLALFACATAAIVAVGFAGAGIYWTSDAVPPIAQVQDPGSPLPFPAAKLRISHEPPPIHLRNQAGEPTSLGPLRGRVVILTGVYTRCPTTCSLIMAQARQAVARLDSAEQQDVYVIAVTLDPEHDDQAALRDLADRQGLDLPHWNLCTGNVEEVNRLLDRMGIERRVDPATGIIDHSNQFLVVDRSGKVAYRFSLGYLQEDWMVEALKLLCAERGPQS
ncbi:MAG: SCO family protein [Planctomycetes bacterium]|nr:SCO family protein [Planctomycetota bacterium]